MKSFVVTCLLVVTLSDAAEVTPVQKVIQLLVGMKQKGTDEMHKEQVQFASYKQFCVDTADAKEKEVAELTESIERLTARIAKAADKIDELADTIHRDENDVARWTGDQKAETEVRRIQKADFDELHADYSESIDALQRAIEVLKEQDKDTAQTELVQLQNAPLIPADAKTALATFLAQDDSEPTAPEANAYEFQSGGIIAMLNKLLDKFIDERTSIEKDEANAKHAFEMVNQDLTANIDNTNRKISENKETKAETAQQKADDEGNKQEDTDQRTASEEYRKKLVSKCESKGSDFESRQKLRGEELEAIEKAIEILESDDVSGNADKHLPSAASFSQLGSNGRNPAQGRAATYLQNQAKQLNSRVLAALATHVADDPFAKVKKMIKDLIVRLMEEANEEAEHKGWCDTELATNEQTRNEKTARVEKLHAQIDELNSQIAKLGEEIAELATVIAETTEELRVATEKREEAKATNKETVEDAIAAQQAVARALEVLKEFYAKAGSATAFVQQHQEPEIFDKPYTGLGGEAGGVVGMLEVIESDFARLQADTEAQESKDADDHHNFAADSNTLIEVSKKSSELKTKEKQDKSQTLQESTEDLTGTQTELDAALEYYDKLKPSCVNSGVSYEDRVQKRQEEIQSLQEALTILQSYDENA